MMMCSLSRPLSLQFAFHGCLTLLTCTHHVLYSISSKTFLQPRKLLWPYLSLLSICPNATQPYSDLPSPNLSYPHFPPQDPNIFAQSQPQKGRVFYDTTKFWWQILLSLLFLALTEALYIIVLVCTSHVLLFLHFAQRHNVTRVSLDRYNTIASMQRSAAHQLMLLQQLMQLMQLTQPITMHFISQDQLFAHFVTYPSLHTLILLMLMQWGGQATLGNNRPVSGWFWFMRRERAACIAPGRLLEVLP